MGGRQGLPVKWILLSVAVFLGSIVAFVAMPRSTLHWARNVVVQSLEVFTDGSTRVAVRTNVPGARTDAGSDRVESRRRETIQSDLAGRARVIDGDTIEVGTARIRLFGVDAPESAQSCVAGSRPWPCGRQATQALAGQIDNRSVACEERDRDRYGRIVAVCRHSGHDVNAWLVREGWAMAYRRYSTAYVDEEEAAKAAQRGLWSGEFVPPWDWRRGERLMAATRDAPRVSAGERGGCKIKGNISHNSGRRIYHMPGGRDYERTRISTSRGERYFCTEAEARAAGWRRGEFVPPRDGRRGERLTAATRDAPRVSAGERGGCKIKGNISHNSGRRIYHMPGGRDYERTRISTSRGERYFCTEAEARAAGWRRGEFVPPRDGRRGERLTAATRDAPRVSAGERGGCKIKGNISHNSGRRIYHMPGGRDYERTRISTSRGERYFCTEAEARAAGWRRAGR